MREPHEKAADLLLEKNHIRVLFGDNHLLVVHKPPGLSTQSDGRTEDLLSLCREYVRLRFQKPGKAFLGLVHRLDRPVEGIVVFARTSKGAARLSEQFREHTVRKVYLALVSGNVIEEAGVWTDSLVRQNDADAPGRRAHAAAQQLEEKDHEDHDPLKTANREARLEYRVIGRRGGLTLLEILLHTGRLHQIRFQCASRGFPIEGDQEYGPTAGRKPQTSQERKEKSAAIALAAVELGLDHPVTGERLTFRLEPLPAWAAR